MTNLPFPVSTPALSHRAFCDNETVFKNICCQVTSLRGSMYLKIN